MTHQELKFLPFSFNYKLANERSALLINFQVYRGLGVLIRKSITLNFELIHLVIVFTERIYYLTLNNSSLKAFGIFISVSQSAEEFYKFPQLTRYSQL